MRACCETRYSSRHAPRKARHPVSPVPAMDKRGSPHGFLWLVDRPLSRAMTPPRNKQRQRKARTVLQAAMAALIGFGGSLTFVHHTFAQDTPYVPDEWKYGRHQSGATLRYCLDTRDPDLPVARKIAQAIAEALLLEPKPHELGQVSA